MGNNGNKQSALLALPRELRDLIYQHLTKPVDVGEVNGTAYPQLVVPNAVSPTMLLVNKQIHYE
jgi:hypothetical protein